VAPQRTKYKGGARFPKNNKFCLPWNRFRRLPKTQSLRHFDLTFK